MRLPSIAFALLAFVLAGAATAKPLVIAVNSPLAYFAQRLAADAATVVMPAPKGEDPAFWQPTGDDIAQMQAADLVLLNGAGFAGWLPQVSLRRARLVDTSAKAKDSYLPGDSLAHTHGGTSHEHGNFASVTWLDFQIASLQAKAIAAAFKRKLKLDAGAVDTALAALQADLAELDTAAKTAGAALKGKALVGSHPVYHYFAAAYGLDMRFLHWEAAEAITAENEADLAALQAERPADIMLFEFPPSASAIEAAKRAGLAMLVLDPLVNSDADFVETMREALADLHP